MQPLCRSPHSAAATTFVENDVSCIDVACSRATACLLQTSIAAPCPSCATQPNAAQLRSIQCNPAQPSPVCPQRSDAPFRRSQEAEKAAREAAKHAERAAKEAQREAARAEKEAAKEAARRQKEADRQRAAEARFLPSFSRYLGLYSDCCSGCCLELRRTDCINFSGLTQGALSTRIGDPLQLFGSYSVCIFAPAQADAFTGAFGFPQCRGVPGR